MPARESVLDLVARVERGEFLEAIEEVYADDVEMRENLNPPTVGKEANLERERGFVASIRTIHENRATAVLVDGDRAVIEWRFEFTNDQGERLRFDQVAVQRWRGDRVVQERFVYDPATVPAPVTDGAS